MKVVRFMHGLVFGRTQRLDNLEREANELIEDIREQSGLTIAAAQQLQVVIEHERKRRETRDDD